VPFANHGGLIATGVQVLRHVGKMVVEVRVKGSHPVDMVVSAGEDGRAARCTNRVGNVAMVEADPVLRDAIKIWCAIDPASIATHRLGGVIIRHDEKDVRSFGNGIHESIVAGRIE